MELITATLFSIVAALFYIVPIILVIFIISQLYNTRQNTKYLLQQNQEIIQLLNEIKNEQMQLKEHS
ncbi:hypothetical protein [Macrococcus capreoli]|uniref:hypothetical protein n=1 Tax=Macrococcus capreoli TaxID=2982690 RepID=UPI0021D58935|nr:hypothetical protein [Macrococcus sp. TMW 2.2395]MCU7556162.1 hypothetical protein [Macrococcus sp. TMW 2.2395]